MHMPSLSQPRRRYRYFIIIGTAVGIVFITIWTHLFSQQNSSSATFHDHPHAEQRVDEIHPIPNTVNTTTIATANITDTTTIVTTIATTSTIITTTIVTANDTANTTATATTTTVIPSTNDSAVGNAIASNDSAVGNVIVSNTSAVTVLTTVANFLQVRRPEGKRRFTSPAVEALIEEIKTNIKNKELAWLFENCFPNTLDTTVDFELREGSEKKPDTYVITGDIDAMWLRDSSAQVNPYIPLINKDSKLRQLIEGVLLRQCLFIQRDPYANAHYKDTNRTSEWKHMDQTDMRPGVHERKWELDSLCYVLRLMHSYWKEVKYDVAFFRNNEEEFKKTIRIILQTMKEQQRFNGSGPYKYQRQGHPADPQGHPSKPIGLIHTFFRPSDDLQALPYLIPSQFFAHHTLKLLLELIKKLEWTNEFNEDITKLISDLHAILFDDKTLNDQATIITYKHPNYGFIYSYEIDGLDKRNIMDDSNIPSLLSLPYLSPDDIPLNHSIYQNTRRYILSPDNPWYFKGSALEGTGGPHCGPSMVWPLAIVMRGLTTTNDDEIRLCLSMLQKTHANTGFMHESINVNNPTQYTRSWFAWANSLFGEFIWKLYREKPYLLN